MEIGWILVVVGILMSIFGFGGKITVRLPGFEYVGAAGMFLVVIGLFIAGVFQ